MNNQIEIFKYIEKSETPVLLINDSKIEFINGAFASLSEYSKTELEGMPIFLIFQKNEYEAILKNEKIDEKREIIIKLLSKNLDIKILLLSPFLINPDKNQYIIFCKDITSTRLEQKKVIQAKLYADSIFSNLDGGVIVVDNERKIINVNNGALNHGIKTINNIVDLTLDGIDILNPDWNDVYSKRVIFRNYKNDTVYLSGNVRKFIVNELFDVFIITFNDITRDVLLEKEIQEKNEILKAQLNKVDKELNYARTIQESMMPPEFRTVLDLTITTKSFIANALGGDYFEIKVHNDKKVMFGIFDVSGHNVASSLVVGMVKALLDSIHLEEIETSSDIFGYLQSGFKNKIPGKHFVASVFMVYDKQNGTANISCGGNYRPVMINGKTSEISIEGERGFAIGFIPNAKFNNTTIPFEKGDKFIMYTDGIVEAENKAGEYFGNDRVMAIIEKYRNYSCGYIKDKLYSDLIEFIEGERNQGDDVTIMAVSRNYAPLKIINGKSFIENYINLAKEYPVFNLDFSIFLKEYILTFTEDKQMKVSIEFYHFKDNLRIYFYGLGKKFCLEFINKFNSKNVVFRYDNLGDCLEFDWNK